MCRATLYVLHTRAFFTRVFYALLIMTFVIFMRRETDGRPEGAAHVYQIYFKIVKTAPDTREMLKQALAMAP